MHPEPYLNHTQLKTWETSPASYVKFFVEGKKLGINRGMALGRIVADALELDEETGDPLKDIVIAGIPKFEAGDDIRDEFMYMTLEHGGIKIPLRIRPDRCNKALTAFKEYKTGPKESWHQAKVDRDSQITFYATGIYIKWQELFGKGRIPDDIELVHAVTEKDEEGRPHLTGEIIRYRTKRTLLDVMKMKVRMMRAWKEIGAMLESELYQ